MRLSDLTQREVKDTNLPRHGKRVSPLQDSRVKAQVTYLQRGANIDNLEHRIARAFDK